MTHPLIPSVWQLAQPVAEKLNLRIVNVVFQTNKNPPVLRIDIQKEEGDVSLDDCEMMSRALEEVLDAEDLIESAYVLEISSPGIGNILQTEREFTSFKGFPVEVATKTPYRNKTKWQGTLQGRDEKSVYLNCRGKIVAIPRDIVTQVQLLDGPISSV